MRRDPRSGGSPGVTGSACASAYFQVICIDCQILYQSDEFGQYIQKFRSKTFLIRSIFVYIVQTLAVKLSIHNQILGKTYKNRANLKRF